MRRILIVLQTVIICQEKSLNINWSNTLTSVVCIPCKHKSLQISSPNSFDPTEKSLSLEEEINWVQHGLLFSKSNPNRLAVRSSQLKTLQNTQSSKSSAVPK